MNLLFAINKNFVSHLVNCMVSVLRSGGAQQYTAYILHSDLQQQEFDRIRRGTGGRVDCRFVTVDPELFEGFPESRRYPRQIYYRLAAPLLLPAQVERVLYLDVDTVVINSLQSLYGLDFEGAYFAACTHTDALLTKVNQARLGAAPDAPYINTGVMLYNMPALRQNLRLQDIRDYGNAMKHALMLPDQDILTALYGDKVKLIDTMRYNLSDRLLAWYNANPRNPQRGLDWVRKNAVVIHYYGKNKPWKAGYIGELDALYHEARGWQSAQGWEMEPDTAGDEPPEAAGAQP